MDSTNDSNSFSEDMSRMCVFLMYLADIDVEAASSSNDFCSFMFIVIDLVSRSLFK